jgi:hypothetical protein
MDKFMTDKSNIVDKEKYQTNRRWMAWTALGTMLVATGAVLVWPASKK